MNPSSWGLPVWHASMFSAGIQKGKSENNRPLDAPLAALGWHDSSRGTT
jgi:hypothetical protein